MSIQNAYNEWSGSYDTDRNLTRDLDHRVTQAVLANVHFNSILELGCGTGKNTVFLSRIGTRVHALDFSQGMIDKAKEKVQAENVKFSVADLTKRWPCNDAEIDLIVCNLVLEHIENLSFVFSEAARVLHNMGRFFITELHPFKQYEGKKARFLKDQKTIEVDAFVHHISDYVNTAMLTGLQLIKLNEYWHDEDQNQPPRIISFLFEK